MKQLRVLAEARQEFADALRWYRRQAPAFAEALALEYRQIVRHVQEFPDAGAVEAVKQSMTVRRYLLHQFPVLRRHSYAVLVWVRNRGFAEMNILLTREM